MRPSVILAEEIAIGFIEDQPGAIFPAENKKLMQQARRIHGPGGIVWCHDGKHLRAGRKGRLGRTWIGKKADGGVAIDQPATDPQHRQRRIVVEIEGIGQRDRIARAGKRDRRTHERLIAAGGNVDIAGGKVGAVKFGKMSRVGLAQ